MKITYIRIVVLLLFSDLLISSCTDPKEVNEAAGNFEKNKQIRIFLRANKPLKETKNSSSLIDDSLESDHPYDADDMFYMGIIFF